LVLNQNVGNLSSQLKVGTLNPQSVPDLTLSTNPNLKDSSSPLTVLQE